MVMPIIERHWATPTGDRGRVVCDSGQRFVEQVQPPPVEVTDIYWAQAPRIRVTRRVADFSSTSAPPSGNQQQFAQVVRTEIEPSVEIDQSQAFRGQCLPCKMVSSRS